MGRQFNGVNQTLESAAAVTLGSATLMSLSYWSWWDTFANTNEMLLESSAASNSNNGTFLIQPNESNIGKYGIGCRNGGTANLWVFTRPSANAWHHYAVNLNFTAAQSVVSVYVDGVSQSISANGTTTTLTGSFLDYTWYVHSRGNASFYAPGSLAQLGVWTGVSLSSGDATNLSSGWTPDLVQPASLKYWWQCKGETTTETGSIGGINLTVDGGNANCWRSGPTGLKSVANRGGG